MIRCQVSLNGFCMLVLGVCDTQVYDMVPDVPFTSIADWMYVCICRLSHIVYSGRQSSLCGVYVYTYTPYNNMYIENEPVKPSLYKKQVLSIFEFFFGGGGLDDKYIRVYSSYICIHVCAWAH